MDERSELVRASQAPPRYPDPAGTVAVVTGGSGGVGAATCWLLAAHGARVVVAARARRAIDGGARTRAGGGRALGVSADCPDAGATLGERRRGHAVTTLVGPTGDAAPKSRHTHQGGPP